MFMSESERRKRRKALLVSAILSAAIAIVFVVSMNTGVIRLSPIDVLRTLAGGGTERQQLILFDFRLPRIVISLLIGAGLAVSGAVLQALSRNALADPGIIGINSGAGLTVLLFIAYYPAPAATPAYLLPLLAWAGGGVAAALVFLLSYRRHMGLSSNRLILNGVAVNSGFAAVTIVVSLRINPEQYQFVATWMAGSIWGKDWSYVLALLPFIAVLLPYVLFKARTLNVLNLGTPMATGLGTFVNREQALLLAAAVGLAGSCAAVSGSIGFVGLIAPHLARRLVGQRYQALLPVAALSGALLVMAADTIAKVILQPAEIPTGIIVAAVGAPYFLYLLYRSK
ncbi:FecCD family ABC transporter permease [Paenibacillus sp. D51F]